MDRHTGWPRSRLTFDVLVFRLVCWLVAAIMLVVAITIHAEGLYGVIGVGAARLDHTGDNGTWVQEGYDYVHEKRQPTWLLGVGLRLNDRIRIEADYRDFGAFNAIVRHTTDEAYDPTTHRCHGHCPPTQTGFIHSDAKGIAFSGTYDVTAGQLRPFVRGGLLLVTSKTVIAVLANPSDPYDRAISHYDAKRQYSATPMFGLGVRFDRFALEYDNFVKVGGYDAPMGSAETVTLSYRLEF